MGGTGPDEPDRNEPDRREPGRNEPDRHDIGREDPGWHGPGSHGPYPHEQPRGDEPLTARSPLLLRAVLSAVALVGAVAAAIVFTLNASGGGPWTAAGICAAVAVIAAVDLVVIARRARH
ncbi:DUF6343 family protein [Actinomadura luteofluorescens]